MKLRSFITLFLAGAALTAAAQGYKDGIEYYKADRFNNARELLQRNLNAAGTDKAASYYYLGMIDLNNGKQADARANFEKGIQANPEYAYNYVGLGAIDLLNHNNKAAEENFKLGDKRAKKDAGVQIAIARAYYKADPAMYAKEIAKRIEKARKANMEDPEIYMFEGDRAADQKKWGDAASMYEMATSYDPTAAEGYVKGAEMLMQVNPGASINMLKNLLAKNPQSALGQRELANTYYDLQKYEEAAAEYGKYVNNPNHFAQDEDRYAFLLFYSGNYKKAYDYATKLLASNPDNFTARRYQFMNAAQLPELASEMLPMADKLAAAHKADKANVFAPIDYTLIADEYSRNDRTNDAVAILEEGIKEMPDQTQFYDNLATVYIDGNNIPAASDAFRKYLAKTAEPTYNDLVKGATYAYYAGVTDKTSDAAKAKEYFAYAADLAKKANTLAPTGYKAVKLLGDIARQESATPDASADAAKYYKESLGILDGLADKSRFSSDAVEMANYIGIMNYNAKNDAEALKYFNKALEYDPDNEGLLKLIGNLKK